MALYTENFDSLSAGQNPASWTVSPASGTWGSAASAAALSGANVYGPASRTGQSWACYTGSTFGGCSVLVAIRFSASASGKCGPAIQCITAANPVLQGYVGTLEIGEDGAVTAQVRRIGFSPMVLATASGAYPDGSTPQLGDWIFLRLGYDTTSHQALLRWWKNGAPEPSTWTLTAIDSSFTSPGYSGVFADGANPAIFDNFEIDSLSGVGVPAPTISSFSPVSGPVGAVVTLNGTNFSATPAGNAVRFGASTPVTPLTASTTQLTAVVPASAQTAFITVTTAGGTATSATSFTLTAPPGGGSPPTITSIAPTQGSPGTVVLISGSGFDATASNDQVTFAGAPAPVTLAAPGQLTVLVPVNALTGPVTVTTGNGSATGPIFTVLSSSGGGITGITADTFGPGNSPDDGALNPAGLIGYLRAMLKDTLSDIAQLGLDVPIWSDSDLYRYLELARGEYTRHRPKPAYALLSTIANQQIYPAPAGCLAVREVIWAPAGYDLDQVSALAASLAGEGGMLWGGGVPLVGQVYFDSPASIQVWSILREAWRNTFGGHWLPLGPNQFWLIPGPTAGGLNVLVFYDTQCLWTDIPWQNRMFILLYAELLAIQALTAQIVAQAPAQGQKLNLGLRALAVMIEDQYKDAALNLRQPGVTAGRS